MDPDKLEHKARLAAAVNWRQENPTEKLTVAGRIFKVQPDAIRMAIQRQGRKDNRKLYRGHNKILSETQTEAIRSYCKEHYESGMGATKEMVFAAIGFLKTQEEPPKQPPLWRWFQNWLKDNNNLFRKIKTKLITQDRVKTYNEKDVENWFDRYCTTLDKYGIKRGKNIYNMDELGVRVRCPKGEEVIVPIDVKEIYMSSPENRKLVTIIEAISADGQELLPPFIICLGKRIIEL